MTNDQVTAIPTLAILKIGSLGLQKNPAIPARVSRIACLGVGACRCRVRVGTECPTGQRAESMHVGDNVRASERTFQERPVCSMKF